MCFCASVVLMLKLTGSGLAGKGVKGCRLKLQRCVHSKRHMSKLQVLHKLQLKVTIRHKGSHEYMPIQLHKGGDTLSCDQHTLKHHEHPLCGCTIAAACYAHDICIYAQ